MAQNITVQITRAGINTGPFTLYDQNDNVIAAGVSRADLLAGQVYSVADDVDTIRCQSTGDCTTFRIYEFTPSGSGTTTTTTTTSTTTTTTTSNCVKLAIQSYGSTIYYSYTDCDGVYVGDGYVDGGLTSNPFCAVSGTWSRDGGGINFKIQPSGSCDIDYNYYSGSSINLYDCTVTVPNIIIKTQLNLDSAVGLYIKEATGSYTGYYINSILTPPQTWTNYVYAITGTPTGSCPNCCS
jgi:hypothetical protein